MFPTSPTELRSTGPPTFSTSMNLSNRAFRAKMSRFSAAVSRMSPATGALSFPSPELRLRT